MSKKLHLTLKENSKKFNTGLINKLSSLHIDDTTISEITNYIATQDLICYEKDEIEKSRRIKKTISSNEQCNAIRIDGNRCTRRKKFDSSFCGTHLNCQFPMEEFIPPIDAICPIIDKIVSAIDVHGIIYYIDQDLIVYKTEDVLKGVIDPKIIGHALKKDDVYTIPSLGLM